MPSQSSICVGSCSARLAPEELIVQPIELGESTTPTGPLESCTSDRMRRGVKPRPTFEIGDRHDGRPALFR